MSEPMSNHEIEDVLSSIRRLVSDDLRPAPRTSGAPDMAPPPLNSALHAVQTKGRPADKLLLTPALRVVEQSPLHEAPLHEALVSDPADLPDQGHSGFLAEEEVRLDPDLAESPSHSHDGWAVDDDGPHWQDEGQTVLQAPLLVEDVVSKLGAAVTAHDDEWESPLGDVDPLTDSTWPEATPSKAAAPAFTFVHRPRETVVTAEGDGQNDRGAQSFEHDFMAPMPEAFAPAEDFGPDWQEPLPQASQPFARRVVTPPDDLSGQGWADVAEAAVMEDLARDVEQQTADLFDDGYGGMTFDEEVLRDLVRDIIREELAGTLGERITRNVRKLVRAEIARALAVREFE